MGSLEPSGVGGSISAPNTGAEHQHGVDIGLRGELEQLLSRLGEPVAVSFHEDRPVVIALVRHDVYLFILYSQHARVVIRHHVVVPPDVVFVRVLLISKADVLPGPHELPFPNGLRL